MKRIDEVYQTVITMEKEKKDGVTADQISSHLDTGRANISRYLNQLCRNNKLKKINGRPVLYKTLSEHTGDKKINCEIKSDESVSLDYIIGSQNSLRNPIQQAKAAILYPPRGLHTMLLGETGVGKSMFAELMHSFAVKEDVIEKGAPFIQFNCADYADNPQLVMAQIFGVKQGAYTGANKDRIGLLLKADGGILFLDEIHRLSPQGQEMLFTYIDKGYFRPLGETDKEVNADVQIIAATTEDPTSYLLKTFIRRIPMTINLPSLKDRGLDERYNLVESFLKEESKRVGKGIYINKNSLISFLLYDCPNNIGQLNSDIQLACAKAFLTYKSEKKEYIIITQPDLPLHVKRGLMKLPEYREKIEYLVKDKGEVLCYHYEDGSYFLGNHQLGGKYFYDFIEEKIDNLQNEDLNHEKINQILNIDIEEHFKKHIENLPPTIRKEEIIRTVGKDISSVVEEILTFASSRLDREYDDKIYLGLALHLQKAIDRIMNGEKIYHTEIDYIRINYPDEFITAMEIAKIIDGKFNIETPIDEIGYISMFLVADPYKKDEDKRDRVGVIVIMHGKYTASSMVEVANQLVGVEHAIGLDMPLNMNPESMFDITMEKIKEVDKGCGVILLVDMGSLINFGDIIYEKTGILVKTIDMVSTAVVIDVCRKAALGQRINEIYNSCSKINRYKKKTKKNKKAKNAIITACFTGKGSSRKLKEILEENIVENDKLEIIPLNILNHNQFMQSLEEHKIYYNILAVISTIDVDVGNIPYFSAIDILSGDGIEKIKQIVKIVDKEDMFLQIQESIKEHIRGLNNEELVDDVRIIISEIEKGLGKTITKEVTVGVVLHLCFMVDKINRGGSETEFENLLEYQEENKEEIKVVRDSFINLEKNYNIKIGDNEIAYITKMFLEN